MNLCIQPDLIGNLFGTYENIDLLKSLIQASHMNTSKSQCTIDQINFADHLEDRVEITGKRTSVREILYKTEDGTCYVGEIHFINGRISLEQVMEYSQRMYQSESVKYKYPIHTIVVCDKIAEEKRLPSPIIPLSVSSVSSDVNFIDRDNVGLKIFSTVINLNTFKEKDPQNLRDDISTFAYIFKYAKDMDNIAKERLSAKGPIFAKVVHLVNAYTDDMVYEQDCAPDEYMDQEDLMVMEGDLQLPTPVQVMFCMDKKNMKDILRRVDVLMSQPETVGTSVYITDYEAIAAYFALTGKNMAKDVLEFLCCNCSYIELIDSLYSERNYNEDMIDEILRKVLYCCKKHYTHLPSIVFEGKN